MARTARWPKELTEREQLLLCDAQTSGGLLMSVERSKADTLLAELQAFGVVGAVVVGAITEGPEIEIRVSP